MYRIALYVAVALSTFGVVTISAAADDRDAGHGAARQAQLVVPPDDSATCLHWEKGEEAVAACNRLIERNPKDDSAYTGRAAVYGLDKGDLGRAIADVDQAIALFQSTHESPLHELSKGNPAEVEAMLHGGRGLAWLAKGGYDRAIADFGHAIGLNTKDAAYYVGRGATYHAKGDYDHAIADLDVALDSKLNLPGDLRAVAHGIRGAAYGMKGEYDRAIADLDQAIQSFRPNPPALASFISYLRQEFAYGQRGFAYGKKRDFDRAMADLNKAIELGPRYARGYAYRAAVHALRGDAGHAIADADEAIRLDPNDAVAYNVRGRAYFDRGQYAAAIFDYDQAMRLDPSLAEVRQNRERAQAVLALSHPPGPQAAPQTPPGAREAAAGPATQPKPPVASPSVPAERRVALVIGNSQYRAVPALPNPKRDAQAVADALRQAGFETVEMATDLDRDGMVKALRSFRDTADRADWALVYFAGHGIEINRVNYLIPVDAKLADDRDVKEETVSYETLLNAIGGARALRLVVLDACRVNPFRERMHRTVASRGSLDRGLAPPPETEPGTLVVYSAKEGEVAADDVDGVNSPFARAFVARLKLPGREVRRMFDDVRDDVLNLTNRRQQPFTYGSLPGSRDFFFVAGR